MKNFINKNVIVLLIAFAFIFSFSGVSAQQVCVTANGGPGQISGGVCIPVGGGSTTGQPGQQGQTGIPTCQQGYTLVNVNGQPMCQPNGTGGAQGGPSYTQGSYQRQMGANQADLSFFSNLIGGIGGIVRLLPPILLGLGVVFFFWFLIMYLIKGKNDAGKRKEALQNMMYSLIAIFIMVTLWGIIAFFGDFIGINPNVQVNAPVLPIR